MPEMTYAEAIRAALRQEMQRDQRVFLFGEDTLWRRFGVTLDYWTSLRQARVETLISKPLP
jgi:pyruvate/2-oxoglutarate/acetoin dehydrogenase E1 component